jgi:hypothetical protein
VIPGLPRSPDQNPIAYRSPGSRGMAFEDLEIKSGDGIKLHGWFVPCNNRSTSRTVIYCH